MDRRLAGLIVVFAALAGCARGDGASSSNSAAVAHVGKAAPDWSEPSIPGPTLSHGFVARQGGLPELLRDVVPAVQRRSARDRCPCSRASPLEASRSLASTYSRVRGKAAAFRSGHHLSYPVVVDGGALRNQYEVNGLPVHVFIDRNGVVQKIVVGELSPTMMRANIESALR